MILGIDKGSVLTKTTSFTMRSIVREVRGFADITELEFMGEVVTLNSHQYVIGERGDFATDMLKGKDDCTRVLVYSSIVKSKPANGEKVDIVVGLPFGQYTLQKDDMQELLASSKPIHYERNGKEGQFVLNRVSVFPEGAGVYYAQGTAKYGKKKILIIDIGGVSVDVALFDNGKLVSFGSYPLGIMKLFSKMATEVNRLYQTEYTEWDMDTILAKGLVVDGQVTNKDFLNEIMNEHATSIVNRVRREYDIRSMEEVPLAGGGGELLHDLLYGHIPQAILVPNPVIANVQGFQNVAEVMYNAGS